MSRRHPREHPLYAFVDESIRGSTYLMCAVLVAPSDLARVRRTLTDIRLPGQARIHLYKERPSRRRLVLDVVARLPIRSRIYLASGTGSEPGGRAFARWSQISPNRVSAAS